MTWRLALAGLAVFAASVAAAQTPAPSPAALPSDAGKKIYEREKCASCHQIANRGNSRFPLDGVGARLSARDLRRWMTHTAEMEAALPRLPAIRMSSKKYRLRADELDALVAYLLTLK